MPSAKANAAAAQQLLDNDTFVAVLDALERDAVDSLADADVSDPASLVRATADLQAARRVREHVQSLVTTGMVSERTAPAVA